VELAVLFSGGKDSVHALHIAAQKQKIACLVTLASANAESYMFHTPNIDVTALQADALGIPLVRVHTAGVKEAELTDLEAALSQAKAEHGIEGAVTGAIESVYQAERVQRICGRLGLWCFNPLWKKDQVRLLEELVDGGYKVIISGVFAYPFDEKWLGRQLDRKSILELVKLRDKYQISPSGEGGEIETTVLDAPMFKKRIEIQEWEIEAKGNSGVFCITKARLAAK
jgi:diphthine-ammonia ligase